MKHLFDNGHHLFLQILHVVEAKTVVHVAQMLTQLVSNLVFKAGRSPHNRVVECAVAVTLQHHHRTVGQFGFGVLFLREPFDYPCRKSLSVLFIIC